MKMSWGNCWVKVSCPHGDFHDEPEGTGKRTYRSWSEILPSSKSSAPIRTRGRAIVAVGLGERLRRTLRVACTGPETRVGWTGSMSVRLLLLTLIGGLVC